jgi:hypothetical protein
MRPPDTTSANRDNNYKTAEMLPRIYRSQMSTDHAYTFHTPIVLPWFNGPKMPETNAAYNYKAASNIPATNHTAAQMLPRIYRSQMS